MLARPTSRPKHLLQPRKRLPQLRRIKRQRRSRTKPVTTQLVMKTRKAIKKNQAMRPPTAFNKQPSTGISRVGAATT